MRVFGIFLVCIGITISVFFICKACRWYRRTSPKYDSKNDLLVHKLLRSNCKVIRYNTESLEWFELYYGDSICLNVSHIKQQDFKRKADSIYYFKRRDGESYYLDSLKPQTYKLIEATISEIKLEFNGHAKYSH